VINILIAEDDDGVRLSLANILKTDSEIRVVGEADNGLDAIELAKTLLPDLVLMDIRLPKADGLEASKQIKEFCAAKKMDNKILILSTFYDDEFVLKSQEYGVDGYLLKGMFLSKLVSAIKSTCNGYVTLDPVIYEKKNMLSVSDETYSYELRELTNTELSHLQ
jgi:DNA-binding NarL/FixJ family response regulator